MDKPVRPKIYRAYLIHSRCPIAVDPLTNKSMRMAEVYSFNFLVYPTNFLWFTAHWLCELEVVSLFYSSPAFYHDHSFLV